jgi:hypothetical protein
MMKTKGFSQARPIDHNNNKKWDLYLSLFPDLLAQHPALS